MRGCRARARRFPTGAAQTLRGAADALHNTGKSFAGGRFNMTSRDVRFHQVDVFTRRAGAGNPLGVVLGADAWTTARMQRFAHWANLVETTFVLAPDAEADYRLRIFTPAREIAFAGHPSIGSAHVVLSSGRCRPRDGRLLQLCEAGLLPLEVGGDSAQPMLSIAVPPARVIAAEADALAQITSLIAPLALGRLPPGLVAGGRRWWLAELAHERDLRAWQPDHRAIAQLAERSDTLGLCAFARSVDPNYELAVRAFPAGAGIVEDPASGAANALIAAYIAALEPHGPLSRGYRVSQGRELGRDAHLHLRIDPGAQVWVGGHCADVIAGTLSWPDAEPDVQ